MSVEEFKPYPHTQVLLNAFYVGSMLDGELGDAAADLLIGHITGLSEDQAVLTIIDLLTLYCAEKYGKE